MIKLLLLTTIKEVMSDVGFWMFDVRFRAWDLGLRIQAN